MVSLVEEKTQVHPDQPFPAPHSKHTALLKCVREKISIRTKRVKKKKKIGAKRGGEEKSILGQEENVYSSENDGGGDQYSSKNG